MDKKEKSETSDKVMSRKDFLIHLKEAGAAALAAVVGGTAISALAEQFAEAAEPAAQKYRYAMAIDTRRCVGCKACVVACKAENKTPPGVSYRVVVEGKLANEDERKPSFLSMSCNQCDNPSCVKVCPVGATFKRRQDGIVVIDYDRCIGCRYCITACPYGARYFDFGENYPAVAEGTPLAEIPSPEYEQFRARQEGKSPVGNVRKCTFCVHLQDEKGRYDEKSGRWPACVKTCTGHALYFGDLNDPESEISRLIHDRRAIRLKEEFGTNPNVYYLL